MRHDKLRCLDINIQPLGYWSTRELTATVPNWPRHNLSSACAALQNGSRPWYLKMGYHPHNFNICSLGKWWSRWSSSGWNIGFFHFFSQHVETKTYRKLSGPPWRRSQTCRWNQWLLKNAPFIPIQCTAMGPPIKSIKSSYLNHPKVSNSGYFKWLNSPKFCHPRSIRVNQLTLKTPPLVKGHPQRAPGWQPSGWNRRRGWQPPRRPSEAWMVIIPCDDPIGMYPAW
jgi:hypothetical protein